MPTRKNALARNATGEHVNTKTSRQPRRSTQTAAAEKKVNDLITSSSKKQKPAGGLLKKNRVPRGGRKLTSVCDSTDNENEVADVPSSSFLDHKQSHENDEDRSCDSIFSPTFHHQNEDDSDCLSKGYLIYIMELLPKFHKMVMVRAVKRLNLNDCIALSHFK